MTQRHAFFPAGKKQESFASWRWRSLRVRLAAAMLLVFLLALAASTVLDRMDNHPVSPEQEPYQDALVLGGFSLAALTLIWLVSHWSLKPVARASHEAARAGPNHPGARLTTENLPSEIRPLVNAMNGALDRMESAYEAERRFTADAAHELRTPLTVLSLRLQRAGTETTPDWPAIEGDIRQMTHLVNQLLALARHEQTGREPPAQSVNLSRVAREAAAMIAPLAAAESRGFLVDLPETMPILGRANDLRDMVLNLLHNALTHGCGTISLRGAFGLQTCRLDVSDEGPGVPPDQADAMFQRFRKAKPNSHGTGLGLAIVREVAESHGGTIAFVPGSTCLLRTEFPSVQ